MKKVLAVVAVTIMIAVPLVFGSVLVNAQEEKKGIVKIDQPAEAFKGGKKKKTPVEFNHEEHGKTVKCLECHHKSADEAKLKSGEEKPKVCTAQDCHGPAEKVVDGKKMPDSEDAYHTNCKGCHKKEKKGPTKCKQCHPGSEDE